MASEPKLSAIDCSVPLNAAALHDLVAPANQCRSIADLILKKYRGQLDDDAEVLFGFLQDSADKLQNLLSGLRTYMQIVECPEPYRQLDTNVVLSAALATIRDQIERSGARITADSMPGIYGDPRQIRYIFTAMIENSIKFRAENPPEIHVTAIPEAGHSLFTVSDNGIGVDPRHSESIFGVFKRVHRDGYPGAGIGLAVARHIVQQHGGRIWVESSPGHGARFNFALPPGPR